MHIDLLHFTPWQSLIGGVVLGVAAALLILMNGKILGISGIIGGLLDDVLSKFFEPHKILAAVLNWRLFFLIGMAISPWIWLGLTRIFKLELIAAPTIDASFGAIAMAGILVGFGTRLGQGCTSGHGVCGLARLSRRSLVATITFMSAGFLTVFVIRHVL